MDYYEFFKIEYEKARTEKSDIYMHIPILYALAKECETVTEMGVRSGVSTRAFLYADVDLVSYDIEEVTEVRKLFDIAKNKAGKFAEYLIEDVTEITIDPTDMLFIDTLHTYEQVKKELHLHANKVNKYIAFHDIFTYGFKDEGTDAPRGILYAILEYLVVHPEWKLKYISIDNNGLLVLERE